MNGMCECCGINPGQLNSSYLFFSPLSDKENDPDCGDWVCEECERQAEEDFQTLIQHLVDGRGNEL